MISDNEFEDLIRQTLRRRADDVEEDLGANLVDLQTQKAVRWRGTRRMRSLSFVAALLVLAGVGVLSFGRFGAEDSTLVSPVEEPRPVFLLPASYKVSGGIIYAEFGGSSGIDVKQYVLGRSGESDNGGLTVVTIRRMPVGIASENGPLLPEDEFGLEVTRIVRSLGEDTLVVTVFPSDPNLASQVLDQLVDQPEASWSDGALSFDPLPGELAEATYSLDDLIVLTNFTVSVDGGSIDVTTADSSPAIQLAGLVFDGRAATIDPLEDEVGWRVSSAGRGWNAILWEVAPGQSAMASGDAAMSEIEAVVADLQIADAQRWNEALPDPSLQD